MSMSGEEFEEFPRSVDVFDDDDRVEESEVRPAGLSLAARMQERQEQLAAHRTERFPLPQYQGLVEVEFQALSASAQMRITSKLKNIPDEALQAIYGMADQLLAATVGFYEVDDDGGRRVLDGATWVDLCAMTKNPPKQPSQRQALLHVVGEEFLIFFYNEFLEWSSAGRLDTDREVMRDFARTE